MTIKSMTGPETGGDVAGREFRESIWSAAQPELYPGPIFQFAPLQKNYLPKAGKLRECSRQNTASLRLAVSTIS
jgi:hypothetical protein